MTLRRTVATTRRVLRQLRHDLRTVALILAVPAVLMGLLAWILRGRAGDFNQFGPPLLGIFPLIVMFLVTSVATLRERTSGTLERLLTTPLAKADFVMGYALAFGLTAVVQALGVAGRRSGGGGRLTGHRTRTLAQRPGVYRIPGRAVHARVHPAAAAALRHHRAPLPTAAHPPLAVRRLADVLRGGRDAAAERVRRGDLRVPARHRCGGHVCGGRSTDRRCDPPPPDPLGHSRCPRTEGDPFGVGEELHERCAMSQWKSAAVAQSNCRQRSSS